MPYLDTLPLAPELLAGPPLHRATPAPAQAPARAGNAGPATVFAVRFASQEIVDTDGRVFAHDLLFRWNAANQPDTLAPGEFLTSAILSNALLDAGVAGRTPTGRLFVNLDEPTLMSPLAELVTATIGVIDLTDAVAMDTPVLMRVAQLRARGLRFCIDGLRDLADPRWLLAPYADYVKLDLTTTRPDQLAPLVARAVEQDLEIIGKRVESMAGYRRLSELGVTQFQGRFISPPVDEAVPALPGCDGMVILKLQRLLSDRASADAIAVAAAADPALVMRLLVLHRLLAPQSPREPEGLGELIAALPATQLAGWLRVLLGAACHGHGARWVSSVRKQLDRYRQSLRRGDGQRCEDIDASLWHFQRRLCGPRHYIKTLRHPE